METAPPTARPTTRGSTNLDAIIAVGYRVKQLPGHAVPHLGHPDPSRVRSALGAAASTVVAPAAAELEQVGDERLRTWAEICAQYPDQFVCLVDIAKVEPRSPEIKTARVVGHGRTHDAPFGQPPIELPRLTTSLPLPPRVIARAERAERAERAWLAGWWLTCVAAPAGIGALRTDGAVGLGLIGAATVVVLAARARG